MELFGPQPSDRPIPGTATHTAQFYDDAAALVARVAESIGGALGAGGAAITIATPDHRRGIAAALRQAGHDVSDGRRAGRYTDLDAADILSRIVVDNHIDPDRCDAVIGAAVGDAAARALRTGGSLVVFGELVALLALDGDHEAAIELERYWNALIDRHSFTLHCGYPMGAFSRPSDSEALARICDAHAAVEPVESYTGLATNDAQARMIVMLQHKEQVLEQEVAAHARTEAALQQQYRELQAALTARDEFLAVAAHELRTPMTGLRGNAQILRRNFEAGREISHDRLLRSLHAIESQSLRLDHLITRLLDASQVEAGTLRLTPAPVDLAALVRTVISQQPPRDSHHLRFDGPDRLETMVDALRFGQVMTNLIDNAIRYSPDGGPVVVRMTSDRDDISISVTDSGVGIPAEQRDVVFTSYRQGRTSRPFTGIGLGLFVSRQIVELHGGSMWIEEPEQRGTRIVITLPATTEAPVAVAHPTHFDAD